MCEKARIREEMLKRRSCLCAEETAALSGQIAETIFREKIWETADAVLAYYAVRCEADPGPVVKRAWAEGKRVYLPRTAGRDMNFLRYAPDTKLSAGNYGIPEPPPDAAQWAAGGSTLVLVPGAAFSSDGWRIGYGGGYYDRFFAGHMPGITPADGITLVGLAYSFQITGTRFPHEKHDVRMDAIAWEGHFMDLHLPL